MRSPSSNPSDSVWQELQIVDLSTLDEPTSSQPASPSARDIGSPMYSYFAINERAQWLLERLTARLEQGEPVVVSYRKAFSLLSGETGDLPEERSSACARWLVGFSTGTGSTMVRGIGEVRLDSFLVNGATRRPSVDHWARVDYEPEQWQQVLGYAKLWEQPTLPARSARLRDVFA